MDDSELEKIAETRKALIDEFTELHSNFLFRQGSHRVPRRKREEAGQRMKVIVREYFELLPEFVLSRCPHCDEPFSQKFDPWGLDGFWWQYEAASLHASDPSACEHFVLLQGAVNLNGRRPAGGQAEAYIGPPSPFVAPKVLNLPTMKMVVSAFEMAGNLTAFPLVYFAREKPHGRLLMQSWRMKTYSWRDETGPAWSICNEPWDFELKKWIEDDKVAWLPEKLGVKTDDPGTLVSDDPSKYPFSDEITDQQRQVIIRDKLYGTGLPDGREIDPF